MSAPMTVKPRPQPPSAPGGGRDPLVPDGMDVELRVHGVGGTPPSDLLDDPNPVQVAGDSLAGFYRSADTRLANGDPCHVEGYSWGGLDSRAASRVFWLLLLPFLLMNLAGWMCSGAVKKSGKRFGFHVTAVHVACLVLTVNAVVWACAQSVDIVYQASVAGVLADHWWTWPLQVGGLHGDLRRQIVVAYLPVVIVIIALMALARLTRRRYEQVRPPTLTEQKLDEEKKALLKAGEPVATALAKELPEDDIPAFATDWGTPVSGGHKEQLPG